MGWWSGAPMRSVLRVFGAASPAHKLVPGLAPMKPSSAVAAAGFCLPDLTVPLATVTMWPVSSNL